MPDAIWEVTLFVDGPVTLRGRYSTSQQKGFRPDDPFYSDITINSIPSGLRAEVTARAPDERLAYEAAVFFFGRMLDVLAVRIDQPLYLSLAERRVDTNPRGRHDVRRRLQVDEIEHAFHEAHLLATSSPPFLRSLGWYRKGLYTEDPFDQFLAFWNSIEVVASKYYKYVPSIDHERAKGRSKSQVWECFKALWGACEEWPLIGGDSNWIDDNYEIRKDVAHGAKSVDITKVAAVASRTPTIRRVAHGFLTGWREKFLELPRGAPVERVPDDGDDAILF